MSQAWLPLFGVILGALTGALGTLFTSRLQEKAEQKRWLRELRKNAYSEALKTLSAAMIIPIGTNLEDIMKWYQKLAEVRECLIVLQAYSLQDRNDIAKCTEELFSAMDKNSFALVATEATTIKDSKGDISGYVFLSVGEIRNQLKLTLDKIIPFAKIDLERLIKN